MSTHNRRPVWLETKRVEHDGNERQDHTHDWEYGPPDPEPTPQEYPRICADCGRLEIEGIREREPRSYADLYEQHHGDSPDTQAEDSG